MRNSGTITEKQAISLVIYAIIGDALIFSQGLQADKDFWLAILLSIVLGFITFFMYAKILTLLPGKDLFDINRLVLGNVIGKLINILYIGFVFHLGALVFRSFTEFITTVALPETPMAVPLIIMVILCTYALKQGVVVLGRFAKFSLLIMTVIVVITITLLIPEWQAEHIIPVFYNGPEPILAGAISTFAFPIAEAIICLFIFSTVETKSQYRVFNYGLLIAGGIILVTSFSEVMVLGVDMAKDYYFPAHNSVRKINIGDFLQRLEIVVGITFVVGGFVKASICILATSKGIGQVLNLKNSQFIITPVAILMANLSYFVYEDLPELLFWSTKVWPYYAIPFQVILPFIILIVALLRKNKLSKK